jgi:hypothetical protein
LYGCGINRAHPIIGIPASERETEKTRYCSDNAAWKIRCTSRRKGCSKDFPAVDQSDLWICYDVRYKFKSIHRSCHKNTVALRNVWRRFYSAVAGEWSKRTPRTFF